MGGVETRCFRFRNKKCGRQQAILIPSLYKAVVNSRVMDSYNGRTGNMTWRPGVVYDDGRAKVTHRSFSTYLCRITSQSGFGSG